MTVSVPWCQMMARYNAEMNRRLYTAAARLDDAARRQDRGAFWGSIHGTFAHLLWADRHWMTRFANWEKNTASLKTSAIDPRPFEALTADRVVMDAQIEAWAATIDPAWLGTDLTWFSGAANREFTRPLAIVLPHVFNHQTHHRGQLHAMITAAGETTEDTDLMLIV